MPAKAAFEGAPNYNPVTALAVPNSEMARLGVAHRIVSGAQQTGYRALAKSGTALTWESVAEVETNALIRGGMTPAQAGATVTEAIARLQKAGVAAPTRMPWGGR